MLHVDEVKFTPGGIFFGDTRTFHLGLKTENFHPGVKWIFWPFCMIFYMFSFYKNTDILITDKRSVISYKLEKKENSCAYRFYISHCCKYCLLALYSCIKYEGGNWKIKGNTEIYSLLSKLNFQYFCSRTWHLERKSNFSNLYKTFTAISATKHGLINKLIA